MKLPLLLQIAGILHLGLAAAGATMPRVVKLNEHLAGLPPFIRRLFYVYFSFIALSLVGFGALTFFCADTLAAGGPLARGVCLFLTAFWTVRLIAAAFIFDVRPYLTSGLLRLGYHATNLVFIYLLAVYVLALWKGGTP
jgi:hypothetical protein